MNKDIIKTTALEDAITVLNELVTTKTLTADLLVKAELTVKQFKNDFGGEVQVDDDGQFWFIKSN